MRKDLETVMQSHGTDLVIRGETGDHEVRGFFRAVNSRSWQSMESEASALGEINRGQYVYLGPAGTEVVQGDLILLGEKTYLVRRAEVYFYQNEALYRWALCVERGVNDTWGIPS